MGSHICQTSLVQHADLVRPGDGIQTVGNDNHRFSLNHFPDGLIHLFFIFRVHECGGLIQDHDGSVL